MTISLAFSTFKVAQLGGNTRIDLDADTLKVRAGSNSDLAAIAPQTGTMTPIPKYQGSTDQILTSPQIVTTIAGGFDVPSTIAFDAANVTFPAVASDAGKSIDWLCIYKLVTNDSDSIPLLMMTGFTPIVPANAAITVQWGSGTNRIYSLPV